MKSKTRISEASDILPVFKRGAIGVIGFILSPLSWWNDLFVNFPLAFGFAWIAGRIINMFLAVHEWLFVYLFVFGYFLSNLAGFLMLHYSIFHRKKKQKQSFKKQLLISFIYSLVIIAFFGLDLCNPEQGCKVLPSWVVH
jgi:hypothetical protein